MWWEAKCTISIDSKDQSYHFFIALYSDISKCQNLWLPSSYIQSPHADNLVPYPDIKQYVFYSSHRKLS